MVKPRATEAPAWVSAHLSSLENQGRLRACHAAARPDHTSVHLDHETLVDFTSNDYLGLRRHPQCCAAAAAAVADQGCGAAGSPVVTGALPMHLRLMQEVSAWLGAESTTLFSSGYQANVGVVTALLRPEDHVFSDAHNHASLVDGCRLSRAHLTVYPHLDTSRLTAALAAASAGRKVVVTDALFSMDGSCAPLSDLSDLCQRHNALLVVDEAHSFGVVGPQGRGLCATLEFAPSLVVGTFSKALGSHGAWVSGAEPLIAYLTNQARALIYSTALPPAVVGAARAAIALCQGPEGATRRKRLLALSDRLHRGLRQTGLPTSGQGTPVAALPFADEQVALRVHAALRRAGLLVWAFRPPTVPRGTSLLRISLTANHEPDHVDALVAALPAALASAGYAGKAPQT